MRIIVLIGFSGSGKDTCLSALKAQGYHSIISYTSRPKRPSEQEGREYFFISTEEFESKVSSDDFIEYRAYYTLVDGIPSTWYYGTAKGSFTSKDNVVILDIEGVKALKALYGDAVKCIFLQVPDNIREQRDKQRGSHNKEEWARRLAHDKEIMETEVSKVADVIIDNINFKTCMEDINNFINTTKD